MEWSLKLLQCVWWVSFNKCSLSADYSESSEGEGEEEREELTLSKLANRSASRTLWRGGEEGAKGSAIGSLAGREEKSPIGWVWKWPRRWKASLDSVLERDDFLPGQNKGQWVLQFKDWKHTWQTNTLDYWPGGGGGGRVGVPVLGGKAGGTSAPAGWFSSWNRFLLSMPNWSAPFDCKRKTKNKNTSQYLFFFAQSDAQYKQRTNNHKYGV